MASPDSKNHLKRGRGARPAISPNEISDLKTRMQAILFSIQDGIVMTDFEDNVFMLNDAAKKMLGIEKRFPYDRKFLDYVADSDLRGRLAGLYESNEENPAIEYRIPREGGDLHLQITKNLVTTASGEILGRVIALRDASLEKNLEMMKDEFVHSITHDLKSPLTSIQGYIDIFLAGDAGEISDEQRHHFRIMNLSTKKLIKLINNILDMAKLEAGKLKVSKKPFDLSALVYRVLESLQGIAIPNEVRLSEKVFVPAASGVAETAVAPAEPGAPRPEIPEIRVTGDSELLERAIGNLVDNALKFTPPGGEVEVSVRDAGSRAEVAVKDTGEGIAPDALKFIFQKFKQAATDRGGTGLGLTIAKYIVDSHGGAISVESRPGRETTFRFWIPKGATPS